MRLVYLGSPAMAVPPLRALIDAGHEIVLVVTNPPRRRGRRSEPSPTPVAAAAMEAGLRVAHDPAAVAEVDAELGVVVAFGRIIAPAVLERLPMVNLHFSLLPRWRGAAPVERALLAGDDRTGVCVMQVEEGLDTGGIYAVEEIPIGAQSTAAELREQLVQVGSKLLVATLSAAAREPEPQATEGVTYAHKLEPSDLELHWDQRAEELSRVVRVGGAWTTLEGRRLKILRAEVVPRPEVDAESLGPLDGPELDAAGSEPRLEPGRLLGDVVSCGEAGLRLLEVQPEGRGAMAAGAFLNGARLGPSPRLGT